MSPSNTFSNKTSKRKVTDSKHILFSDAKGQNNRNWLLISKKNKTYFLRQKSSHLLFGPFSIALSCLDFVISVTDIKGDKKKSATKRQKE